MTCTDYEATICRLLQGCIGKILRNSNKMLYELYDVVAAYTGTPASVGIFFVNLPAMLNAGYGGANGFPWEVPL